MKTIFNFACVAVIAMLLVSCKLSAFFQVYKAAPSVGTIVNDNNHLIFEDDNCTVLYNFWGEGGHIGFEFVNNTDNNIYLNLEECFFIRNGIAYDYFRNRVFSEGKSSGTVSSRTTSFSNKYYNYWSLLNSFALSTAYSTSSMVSSSSSTSYQENKIVCIPPQTRKIINEYVINNEVYRDCDLFRFPQKRQIITKSFSKNDSPVVFGNIITYTVGQSGQPIKFENEFYISEITNYPEYEVIESYYPEICNQKSFSMKKRFRDVSPDKFYKRYIQSSDSYGTGKH